MKNVLVQSIIVGLIASFLIAHLPAKADPMDNPAFRKALCASDWNSAIGITDKELLTESDAKKRKQLEGMRAVYIQLRDTKKKPNPLMFDFLRCGLSDAQLIAGKKKDCKKVLSIIKPMQFPLVKRADQVAASQLKTRINTKTGISDTRLSLKMSGFRLRVLGYINYLEQPLGVNLGDTIKSINSSKSEIELYCKTDLPAG